MNTTNKQDETLEEAANVYENSFSGSFGTESEDFKNGANWQKEQDKVIIDKLIDLLSEFIKMQNDPTYGDLVWGLLIKEQSELLLNSLK